jgi:hypothetical protein
VLGESIRDFFGLARQDGTQWDEVKTPEEIADMRAKPSENKVADALWTVYDDFGQYDVILGAVNQGVKKLSFMNRMLRYHPEITQGIVQMKDPFPQVVLVTDAGKQLHDYLLNIYNLPLNQRCTRSKM